MDTSNYIAIMTGGTQTAEDEYYRSFLENASYIIAADSGYDVLCRLNICPHSLVGDMDSLSPEYVSRLSSHTFEIHRYSRDKDKSDTEIALELAIAKGSSKIYILGGIGTRLDHTLANVYLLVRAHEEKREASLINPWHKIDLLTSKKTLYLKAKEDLKAKEEFISLIPLSNVQGIKTTGLRWNLKDDSLRWGSSRGISNFIVEKEASIQINQGLALVITTRETLY